MANFDELLPKVSNWDVDEEEMLINKIKTMTEDYEQKCSDLSINLNNINRNLHLIEVDFFNALNGLKTLSGNKFMEHVIDVDDVKPEEEDEKKEGGETVEENIKDEHFNTINNILQRSFDFMALRDQQKSQNKNNNNNQEDDTMSMNSKIIGDNLTKNNRGLKLPLIIGTNEFSQNDYVGLVNDEDDEEEDFNNEIKNDVSIPVPPPLEPGVPGQGGEEILVNNPEDFHNMMQQKMGKPIQGQNMFVEGENNENEKEFINPALAMDIGEQDTGLGGLLRSSSIKKPNPNNIMEMNLGMGMNLNRNTGNFNDMRMSGAGGKQQIKLSNFLGADFFGDDEEDDDTSGLFSRPNRIGNRPGGLGMNMVPIIPQNNMLLNNNTNNNQLMMNNQNLINQQNINPNSQLNNMVLPGVEQKNNILDNQINNQLQAQQEQMQNIQQNEKLPLNQRMVMVPNPLLLAMQQKQGQQMIQPGQIQDQELQPVIQPQNEIKVQNEEEKNNETNNPTEANSFQDKRKNLEKLFAGGQKPKIKDQVVNNIVNNENENQNINMGMNQEINPGINMNNMNMNLNSMNIGNNQPKAMNTFMTQKEIEKNQKLESAKNKLNSIFGDDEDEEDDIFSKKKCKSNRKN